MSKKQSKMLSFLKRKKAPDEKNDAQPSIKWSYVIKVTVTMN